MIGHEWAVDLLSEHIIRQTYQHAYLFTGPRGVGRRTLALRFAQALNCPQPTAPGVPCGVCRTCTQIEAMQHPDLAVIQAEQINGILKAEQVREMQHSLSLSPYQARYRIALLLRFEQANLYAANALLKTLEEPPPQVILLVTAESAENLLPTVVSRCEVLRLRPVALEEVRRGLQDRWGLPEKDAVLLSHVSGGRPGYARQLQLQPEKLEQRLEWLEDHRKLLAGNRVERFKYAEKICKDKDKDLVKERVYGVLQTWLSLWRDVLLKAAGASAALTNVDRQKDIELLSSACSMQTAHSMIAALQHTLELLERNVNTRLAVEVLLLDLPRLG
jgi:DNA polymerase-3 subunit delta'